MSLGPAKRTKTDGISISNDLLCVEGDEASLAGVEVGVPVLMSGLESVIPLLELTEVLGAVCVSKLNSVEVELLEASVDVPAELVVVEFGVLVNKGSSVGDVLATSLVGFGRPGASFLLTRGAASGPEPFGAVPDGARSESFKRFSSTSVI